MAQAGKGKLNYRCPPHWAKTWLLHPDAPTVHKPEVIENLHEKIGSKMGFTHITE